MTADKLRGFPGLGRMVQGVRGIGFWNLDARACGEAEAVDGGCVWLVSEVSIQG